LTEERKREKLKTGGKNMRINNQYMGCNNEGIKFYLNAVGDTREGVKESATITEVTAMGKRKEAYSVLDAPEWMQDEVNIEIDTLTEDWE
jgi:hypothetical protein